GRAASGACEPSALRIAKPSRPVNAAASSEPGNRRVWAVSAHMLESLALQDAMADETTTPPDSQQPPIVKGLESVESAIDEAKEAEEFARLPGPARRSPLIGL